MPMHTLPVAPACIHLPPPFCTQGKLLAQEWQDDGDVVYCRPLVEPGEKVVAIEDGMPTWIYEVLVTRPTIDDAIKFVNDVEKAIEPNIPIEPRQSKENPDAPQED